MSRVEPLTMTTIAAAVDVQLVIQALTWAIGIVGGALVACLIWFAMRVIHQLDRVEMAVAENMHKLDIRLTRLEVWREAMIQAHNERQMLKDAQIAAVRNPTLGEDD